MSFFSSKKKVFLLGFIFIILLVIPVTIYILQQQQQTKSKASASTTLSFNPQTLPLAKVGDTVKLDIMIDPAQGTPPNQVSFVKLTINYDPSKLLKIDPGLDPNKIAFPSILEDVTYNETANPAAASITLSVGADPTKVITTKARVATMNFQAKAEGSTQITFNQASTQVLSIGSSDKTNENVLLLSSLNPATITISAASAVATAPTSSPSPSSSIPTPTPAISSSSSAQTTNQPPVCTALGLDRTSLGTAPYSITFTASGNDTDGTINKVSFNFGDSAVEDVTQTGGIGTKSVSVQKAHTYNNPGVYKASAVITDNKGAVSSSDTCTQTITVNNAGASGSTIIATPTSIVARTLPPTGPGDKMIKIGGAAAILSIIGGIILFAL